MPIKSLYVLTTVLYVASGLLLGAAAWSWRNLARRNRITSSLAFRKPARLTAISLAMLAGTLLCDALVGALSSPCAALSPCDAQATPNASVTVHLEEAKPPIDAALIDESNQLTGDCKRTGECMWSRRSDRECAGVSRLLPTGREWALGEDAGMRPDHRQAGFETRPANCWQRKCHPAINGS
jgi:hypothetical protein